jgi:hypothetical protein
MLFWTWRFSHTVTDALQITDSDIPVLFFPTFLGMYVHTNTNWMGSYVGFVFNSCIIFCFIPPLPFEICSFFIFSRPCWPQTLRTSCLSLLNAGIIGTHYCAQWDVHFVSSLVIVDFPTLNKVSKLPCTYIMMHWSFISTG